MIGQTISHYKILEKLGEGGMGVVYKAQDLQLDRLVALKFLPPHSKVSPAEQDRFLQEAKSASSINHPNVCTVHAVEDYEGRRFIVMEYVDGQPLSALTEKGPLPAKQVIDLALQIAEALQEAHSKGIVHRDIKADNVMVNSRNQVKVMDFGLAKLKGAMKLTRTSSTVGTLGYMSPEQIQGGEVDARSDIFSFGVLLFELLTGHLPFRGEHEAAMVYSIVNEDPEPIQKYRPEVAPELVHLIGRTLEKDPADRYQSMSEVAGELRHLKKQTSKVFRRPVTERYPVTTLGTPGEPSPYESLGVDVPAGRSYKMIAIGGAAVVVVIAAIALFIMQRSSREPSGPMVTRVLKISSSNANQPNISADGSWIVFVAQDAKRIQNLYMVHASGGEPKKITEDTIFTVKQVPCFSPDASQIVYERVEFSPKYQQDLHVVSTLGGTSRRLISNATLPVWSPDGKHIAYFRILPDRSYDLLTASADGTDETKITHIKRVFFYNVAWSPDSKKLAYLRSFLTPTNERYTEIFVREVRDSTERQITHDQKIIDDFCWVSTGEIVFNSTRGGDVDLWVIPESGGTPAQLTLGAGADRVPRVSKDAKRLVYVNEAEPTNLWSMDLSTKELHQLTFEDVLVFFPVFSADGAKMIYWRADLFESKQNYYVICNKDGSDPVRFMPTTENYTIVGYPPPRWSPDGRLILIGAIRRDTVRKNPDSVVAHTGFFEHNVAANATRKIADGELLDFSRDGKYVLFRRDRDSIFSRAVLALTTAPENPKKEVRSPAVPPQFSWDSKNVITQDSLGLWLIPIDEAKTKQRVKTPKNFGALLQLPDGKSILGTVWDPTSRSSTLVKLSSSSGTVEKVAAIPPTASIWRMGSSISPDGRTLIFTRSESKNRIILLDNFR